MKLINYFSGKYDREIFEKNNPKIIFNVLHGKSRKDISCLFFKT